MRGLSLGLGLGLTRKSSGNIALLDKFSGAAVAYSLRKLSKNTTSVVRVRRSSDNAEQDFTASEVINGTLTTFTGAGNGFVVTWYDQSGNNNHATQATALLQPRLVSAGSLILVNGKPSIAFDNVALTKLAFPNAFWTYTGNSTVFSLSRNRNSGASQYGAIIAQQAPAMSIGILWQQFPNTETRLTTDIFLPAGVRTTNPQTVNTAYITTVKWENWSTHRTNGNTILKVNGVSQAFTSYGAAFTGLGNTVRYIGAFDGGTSAGCFLGDISEVVVYTTPFTASEIEWVEGNINSYNQIF